MGNSSLTFWGGRPVEQPNRSAATARTVQRERIIICAPFLETPDVCCRVSTLQRIHRRRHCDSTPSCVPPKVGLLPDCRFSSETGSSAKALRQDRNAGSASSTEAALRGTGTRGPLAGGAREGADDSASGLVPSGEHCNAHLPGPPGLSGFIYPKLTDHTAEVQREREPGPCRRSGVRHVNHQNVGYSRHFLP